MPACGQNRGMTHWHPAAPWSGFLKGISIAVAALLAGIAAVLAFVVPLPGYALPAAWLPLLILVAAIPFVVRGYRVDDGVLAVQRLLWITRVPLGTLREASIDPQAGAGSIRLLGNGGLFSFSGWFRNAKLGRYRAFVTDWQRAVVLRGDACTAVLSPADPAAFVRALQAAAPVPRDQVRRRWRQGRHQNRP
jgi:hypothetical protein